MGYIIGFGLAVIGGFMVGSFANSSGVETIGLVVGLATAQVGTAVVIMGEI